MVNENPEPVQAPLLEPDAGGDEFQPEINPLIAEVDKLNTVPDPDISSGAGEQTVSPPEVIPNPQGTSDSPTGGVDQDISAPDAAPAPSVQPGPAQPNPVELQQMAQQAAQYQQVQQRAQLQQEAQRYQQQLETQGYLPDQAQQIAHQYMQTRNAQVDMMKQKEYETQLILGKQAASEHFAKQYGLSFEDMATLRLAGSPEQMEQVAKKIKDDRKVRDELSDLRKAQVPSQQFDNSQGAPEVASNDDGWLDRYNAGDRSPNATAAARRMLGIQ